jgi:hypothetical protein
MFSNIVNSWKTSVLGLGLGGTTLAQDLPATNTTAGMVMAFAKAALLVALGLFSKDHNK